MTIKYLKEYGINKLKSANCEEPSLKIRILIAHVLGVNKEYIITNEEKEVPEHLEKIIYDGIDKLQERMPIEYIIHNKEFMKLNFYVDENVLIPRPDTEVLVEEVLNRCKENDNVLDMCTGSGAIAISIAKYGNNLNVAGIDVSEAALDIAKKNAEANTVKVEFYKSNMFQNIIKNDWDIIVSNPPYIETDTIDILEPEVKKEPQIALDGGSDGLDFYKIIIKNAPLYLKESGILALEIGYNQAKPVMELVEKTGLYATTSLIKDLAGNDRVIICKKGDNN